MTSLKRPTQEPEKCRHYDDARDLCRERRIITPRPMCVGCKQYESLNAGLGDAMEKFIDIATLGRGKKIAAKMSRSSGGCSGCAKRRAAMNRLGDKLKPKKRGNN